MQLDNQFEGRLGSKVMAEDEVHIWLSDVQQVPTHLAPSYRALMSQEELERNHRYRFERDRWRDCVTRALARTVLSRYGGLAPTDWEFEKGEHDKPEVANSPVPLRFNLSHTSRFVVCAVTPVLDIGIDVECIERKNDVLAIADRFFSAQEVKDLFALSVNLQEDRFFDYWTLKEAYMKASGEGISLGLGNFSFHLEDPEDINISFGSKLDDNPGDWRFWLFRPSQDHRMALALRVGAGKIEPKLQLFRSAPLLSEGT